MFFIDVLGPSGFRTVVLPAADLTIGSGPEDDIRLEHPDIVPHQVTFVERANHAVVVDLGSIVNGKAIEEPTVLSELCQITIGPFHVRFRFMDLPPDTVEASTQKVVPSLEPLEPVEIYFDQPPTSSSPTPQMPFPVAREATSISSLLRASDDPAELEFLHAIVAGNDPDARKKYAAWLESRGDLTRAEYLRRLVGPPDEALATYGERIATPWRAAVASRRLPIENCSFEGCPKAWGRVGRGSIDDLRRCSVCVRYVRYVTDMAHARLVAAGDRPVVIDPCVPRSPGDLDDLPPRNKCVIT